MTFSSMRVSASLILKKTPPTRNLFWSNQRNSAWHINLLGAKMPKGLSGIEIQNFSPGFALTSEVNSALKPPILISSNTALFTPKGRCLYFLISTKA